MITQNRQKSNAKKRSCFIENSCKRLPTDEVIYVCDGVFPRNYYNCLNVPIQNVVIVNLLLMNEFSNTKCSYVRIYVYVGK